MVTGCKPTMLGSLSRLKAAQPRGKLLSLHTVSKFLEGLFEPNLISKHEVWGGCSQEVVTVVCSKLLHSKSVTHGYDLLAR